MDKHKLIIGYSIVALLAIIVFLLAGQYCPVKQNCPLMGGEKKAGTMMCPLSGKPMPAAEQK